MKSMISITLLLCIFPLKSFQQAAQWIEDPFDLYECDQAKCKLPSCRCASRDPPVDDPPQFLLLTFDDALSTQTFIQADSLVSNRKNPNGCPVKSTWYVQGYYSDPLLVSRWGASGQEVADHSMTHTAPFAGTYLELEAFRAWASTYAGINRGKITGVRFPLRSYTADALKNVAKMGFTYDSSLAASLNEQMWPYTLNYGAANDCNGEFSLCADRSFKAEGLWEIPMYSVEGTDGVCFRIYFRFINMDRERI